MKTDFNHCESIYWVFTQLCNDKCDHCYNSSGPQGTRISAQDCLRIVRNLPDSVDRSSSPAASPSPTAPSSTSSSMPFRRSTRAAPRSCCKPTATC